MKKTIAKIMAAAMVLSSVVAPAAQAANTATVSTAFITNHKYAVNGLQFKTADGTLRTISVDGTVDDKEYIDGEHLDKLYAEVADFTGTGDVNPDDYVDSSSEKITAEAIILNTKTQDASTILEREVTPVTAATNTTKATNTELTVQSGYGAEVVAGKEFKDVVVLDNADRRADRNRAVRAVIRNGRPAFVWRRNAIAAGYINELRDGSAVRFTLGYQWAGLPFNVRFTITPFDVEYDTYWNGFVKLEGNNNLYTPIRVHYDVIGESVAGANEGILRVVTGTNTIAVYNQTSFSQRLQITNVNSYDMAILKSDYAKGKNLMLNEVFAWEGDKGFNTAYTNIYESLVLDINEFYDTISLGKIDTISARLFKDTKEKLVKAEYAKFIHNGAFRKNKQLKKAIIGTEKSAKKINEKAFYDCKKLTTFKVGGKTLKQVGKNALGGSTDKKSLRIKIKAGSKSKYNEDVKKFKKSGVKKAKFAKI